MVEPLPPARPRPLLQVPGTRALPPGEAPTPLPAGEAPTPSPVPAADGSRAVHAGAARAGAGPAPPPPPEPEPVPAPPAAPPQRRLPASPAAPTPVPQPLADPRPLGALVASLSWHVAFAFAVVLTILTIALTIFGITGGAL